MDTNPTERDFIPYPTNRVVGTIADAEHADAAVKHWWKLASIGSPSTYLHGDEDFEGLSRLDPNRGRAWSASSGCNEH